MGRIISSALRWPPATRRRVNSSHQDQLIMAHEVCLKNEQCHSERHIHCSLGILMTSPLRLSQTSELWLLTSSTGVDIPSFEVHIPFQTLILYPKSTWSSQVVIGGFTRCTFA
jgi:hypothetical protein